MRLQFRVPIGAIVTFALASAVSAGTNLPVQTDEHDFFEPGTQPNEIIEPIADPQSCFFCHALFDDPATTNKPYRWRGSMHAHAGRDPIFHAAVSIANQDAVDAGEACIRCHMPEAFLEGRGKADRSLLTDADIEENGKQKRAIAIETNKKTLKFASLLPDQRRLWLGGVLKTMLLPLPRR